MFIKNFFKTLITTIQTVKVYTVYASMKINVNV